MTEVAVRVTVSFVLPIRRPSVSQAGKAQRTPAKRHTHWPYTYLLTTRSVTCRLDRTSPTIFLLGRTCHPKSHGQGTSLPTDHQLEGHRRGTHDLLR